MYEENRRTWLPEYFRPLFDARSYANMVYLLLSLPLGILYFTVLVTGFSMGFGLLILLIGIPIVAGTLFLSGLMASFERVLANALLGTQMPVTSNVIRNPNVTLWQRMTREIFSAANIKSTIYLIAKFLFGIFGSVVAMITLALTFAFLSAPFMYQDNSYNFAGEEVTSLALAILIAVMGVLLAPIGFRFCNSMAAMWAIFTEMMLTPPMSEGEKRKIKAKRPYVSVPDYDDQPIEEKPKRDQRQVPETPFYGDATPVDPQAHKTLAELLDDRRNIDYE